MATILIRNLDDLVVERLRVRAKRRGVSMEEEARRLLTEGSRPTREEFAAWSSAFRAGQRPNRTRGVELIREDRDR
jgi:plasmid stability protein